MMGSVGEVSLVSALRALGAIQGQSLASPTAVSAVPHGAESTSSSTAAADATEAEQKLSRPELLRVTHQLVDGLLRIQSKAPSSTPSYLSVVLPCLFKLLNNTHQDVRIAADEGINKLIKLLRVSMTHQIICELFLELKRNQSARTVSACLAKFAMLVHRIRPSKRRFYTANLLPVLSAICEREDEQVFEALLDYFTHIAAQLFYYATEKELREFLAHQLTRLSSDTALIRRSIAQTLVYSCQYTRLPLTLLKSLLQHILVELNSLDNPVTGARCAGLFNTLRYLSMAWQQIVNTNPSAALFEAQRTMASTVRPKSGSSNPPQITANSDVPPVGTARNPSISSSQPSEHDLSHIEDEMWSYALFTCLNHVCHPSITVSTAALETLLQLFTTRRPAYLYPRRWLSRNMNWSAKGPEMILSTESSILTEEESMNNGRETNDDQAEAQFRELERTGTQPSFDTADMHMSVNGDLKLVEHGIGDGDGRSGGLTRSVSSASLCSALDVDSGIAGIQNEVQKQLSAVKARLAKEEEEKLINRPARDTEEFSGDADYSIIDTIPSSSDQSIVDRIHTSGSPSENMATKHDRSINQQARLLTLSELLSYLAPEDPIPLSESHWLLPYFALHFCLLPSEACQMYPLPVVAPRTSSQLLVVACLTQLVQFYPQKFVSPLSVDRCCSATQSLTPHDASFPTGVDIVLHLLQKHSDPQLRGQVCLLIGSLISSYLVRMAVNGIDQSDLPSWTDVQAMFHKLLDAVESLLTSTTPGTTFRLALASLRTCANSILTVPEPDSGSRDGSLSLVDHLVDCISRCLVPAARHSYRLVRREFLLLVSQLDWVSINFMETEFFKQPPAHLVRPSRLIDVAWNETWRLLSDSESELRDLASASLVGLSSTLGSADGCHIEPLPLLGRSLERRLHYWYPQSFSYARLPIMSFGLVDCWSDQSLPPCLSGLPTELDVGPGGLQSFSSHRAHLLYLESTKKSKQPRSPVGVWRLFRDCTSALMELPCPSALPDDRYMLHGVIRCLNQLIGHSHVMAYADIWYDTSPSISDVLSDETSTRTSDEDPQTLLSRQRRPRIAMLSWQSLTLLSAAPVTTIDLDLHCELINLCSGCLTRWALFALTEGSVPTKLGSLSLDLHHTYTRFALSLLHHVTRVLFIFWHVIEGTTPSPPPAGVALADPLNPSTPVSIFNTIAQVAQTSVGRLATGGNSAPTKAKSAAAPESALASSQPATPATSHRKRPVSIKLGSPMRKTQDGASNATETRASSNVRRILGYFNHLPHYMELYKTLRTAFQTFKISPDPTGSQDRFMGLLQAYLHTLNRIMGNLRLAETAPYSDELLAYVGALYHLQPAACLEAAAQILRAFVGTNLISHWDSQLVRLYDLALNPSDSNCSLGKSKAEGQKIEDSSSDSDASETADGLDQSVNLLLKQHRMFVDLLVSPELDTNLMASWLNQTQLARAPMTAWIRFARQWRVPVPLSSRASSIKSELEHFFKRFEFIVIHSMESYKWTNCSPLQSGILNLLTHLICLRLNYDQLDTGQRFLKTVLNHCEDLPLEVQRQQTHVFKTPHFGARKLRGLGNDSQAHSFSPSSDYFHSQYLQDANSDQQLVNAMFRFLVGLSYQYKILPAKPSSAAVQDAASGISKPTEDSLTIDLNQVLRMAETLAAEGLDPSSIVLSALVPIVVDLFVIQRPLWKPALSPPPVDNATKNPASNQAEVQREAVLNFLLRRLSHLPASYDQLCLIVEESALQYDDECSDPASIPDDRTERIVSQVLDTVLSNLTSGKTVFRTRTDISALLRLFDHIVLALSSRMSIVNSGNERIRKTYTDLIHRLNETIFATETPKAFDCQNTISNSFYCWAVGQVACVRLLVHLLLMLPPKSGPNRELPISAPTTEDLISQHPLPRKHQFADVLRISVLCLHRVVETIETLLRENPHLGPLLSTLRLSESGLTTSLLMLCQIGLTHLLTLIDLMEPSRYALLCTTYRIWDTNSLHSDKDAEPPDLEQLSRHIRSIGTFEPLFYVIWYRLTSTVPKFTAMIGQSLDVPFCGTARRLLNTELMAHISLVSSARIEVNSRKKNSVILARLCKNPNENSSLTFRRLITMWDSDESPIRSLLSDLAKNKIKSQQLLDICDTALPTMSLTEMRIVLRFLPGHLHPSTARKELALLWNHFISPAVEKASATSNSCCSNCRRTPLPLAIQHSAAQEACRLFEKFIVVTDKNGKMTCLIPPEILIGYHARLPSSLILPSMVKLDQLLRRIISSQSRTATPSDGDAEDNTDRLGGINRVNVTSVLRQIESANNAWLLNCARATLLDGCCCSTNVRMVVRLLHALVSDLSETATTDPHIQKMLHTCCFRCCPRLLQYILTLRPTPSVSSADHYVDTNSEHQSSAITPRVDKLFRLGQQLLFEKIHHVIANPEHLFEQASDPTLRDALQSYLAGLTAAVVQFLGLIPQLPAVDASPMESETLALSFLRVMIQFILWSMGYAEEINRFCQNCPSGLPSEVPLSVTLIQSVLQLLDSLLHTVSTRLGKGVDILGDGTETTLALFITFLGAIDQSASLSQSLTWRTKKLPQITLESGRVGLIQSPLLSSLLVPCQPSLFGPWYPDPVPASTLAWFTLAATSSTASTVLGGNGFRLVQPFGTNGFVQPCQLLSKCRLIRSTFNLPTNPALITLLNTCLSSCVRLLNTSTGSNQDPSTVNHPSSVQLGNLSSISLLGLDPDVLSSVICRVGGLGWLDRRQFEQIWMAYLELLAGTDNDYIHADGGSGGGGGGVTEFESTDLELIEHNQSVVLALHGLTRLLLDVTLRPEPGDPVHSRLHHQPRFGTSHFSYTKLGRKLTSLVALIESGRLNLINKHNPPTQNTDILSNLVTASTGEQGLAGPTIELTSMVEPDLERPTDSRISEGPSQFAVDWLVRRLDSARGYQSDNSTSPITIIQKPATSPSNRYATDYEDLLFSCLQSVQLLYQSCLKPLQPNIPVEPSLLESQQFFGPDGEVLAHSNPAAASPHPGTLSRATARSTTSLPTTSTAATSQYNNKGVALAVRSSVIRSAVILSDLFTSRDQFMWLNGYLRESISKLPPLNEFQAPIHIWLTLGMAKCTAVLELAHSVPNTERLHPAALEPAVRQTLLALQSNLTPVQDAGMEAAMFLLHAALLIRAQPHQRQMQQHSPPTGSPLLNELYSHVCGYVEEKLATLFGPVSPIRLAADGNTIPVDVHQFQSGTLPRGSISSPISTTMPPSTNVGLKRFMMGVFGGMGASSKSVSGTLSTEPYDITAVTSNVASPACTLVDRVERHQLTVLATAFFLTEHFSDPPVYPVVTDSGSGLTEMLSGLTSSLFRLASPMLTDTPSSVSKQWPYSQLGAGTTSELCCSPAVHTAWCRGAERLILTGRLGKGATESLQKLCITRLRTCRSPHLSLPTLRLLVTCMYVNASRLNTQLQRYRHFTSATVSHRLSPGEPVVKTKLTDHIEPTPHSSAAEGSPATTTLDQVTINANGPTDEITVSSQGNSAIYVRADSTSEDADALVLSQTAHSPLPPSLAMDSEATAGMTQEFLSCLWERLRGGVSPIGLPSNSNAAWINNAWTSFTEASIVAQLLPATSTEIIEAVLGVLVTWSSSQEARLDQRRAESVADPVLNKALGEFARLDHAHPDLAAQTLAQLFALFMENESGQCLVRQWVLLSLPTLLGRQPRRLAIWATTVCLLAASTHPALRAAFCLCCCSQTSTPKLGTADRQESSNAPSAMCSSSTIGDLLCLAAVHFTQFGLLRKIEGSGPECVKRNEEREVYLNIFQPPDDTQDVANMDESDRRDIRTLNHVYSLIRDSVRN